MDMRGLEGHLAAANEQVKALTLCMSAMKETNETILAQKERELFVLKGELATATKELKVMRVRDMELKDSLGKAHEEDLGLTAQTVALTRESALLAQEFEEVKAAWALERTSLQAITGRHEGFAAEARLEVERLKAELAAAKKEVEEARLRQLSPGKTGRAQGSGER